MSRFADEALGPCKKGGPCITREEADTLLARIPAWEIHADDGTAKLVRTYKSSDYPFLLALAGKIGAMAEQANHHPVLVIEWGKLTVTWWTHVIDGLHRNDFIMAARCDRAAVLVHGP